MDTSLYEAAKMDGASRLQLIRYVDLPAIMPTCTILLIMQMGSVLNVGFDKIYLMQNTLNQTATEVISTYIYKMGLIDARYSYSAAVSLFNNVINFVFLHKTYPSKKASTLLKLAGYWHNNVLF